MKYSRYTLFLLLLMVAIEVINWSCDKIAALHTTGTGIEFYISLVTQHWFWIRMALIAPQLWVWSSLVKRAPLSVVYPATSVSYPITMFNAIFLFNEHFSWQVWAGAVLVTIGVAMLGMEETEDKTESPIV